LAEAKTTHETIFFEMFKTRKGRSFSFVQCGYYTNHSFKAKRRWWVVTSGAKCLLPRPL